MPFYFAAMALEHRARWRTPGHRGPLRRRYETRDDTLASLSMGVASLVTPLVMPKLLRLVTPGKGRWGKALVAATVGGAAAVTAADLVARRAEVARPSRGPCPPRRVLAVAAPTEVVDAVGMPGLAVLAGRPPSHAARRLAGSAAVTTVAAGVCRLPPPGPPARGRPHLAPVEGTGDLGGGALAVAGAVAVWDAIYYWNHRFMHESRWLWAMHVVHHSSERYNLSTALRQPVADAFGMRALRPARARRVPAPADRDRPGRQPPLPVLDPHRGVNELGCRGGAQHPSHHRVHHGSNRRYIDRNHGSILIVWDRLFGTFEREDEPVVYGLTTNIDTFNPVRIATHEQADILRDVARSRTWRDRLGYVLRGPGWA